MKKYHTTIITLLLIIFSFPSFADDWKNKVEKGEIVKWEDCERDKKNWRECTQTIHQNILKAYPQYIHLVEKDVFIYQFGGTPDIEIKIKGLTFERYCLKSGDECKIKGWILRNCSKKDCLSELSKIITDTKKYPRHTYPGHYLYEKNNYIIKLKSGKKIDLKECKQGAGSCSRYPDGVIKYRFLNIVDDRFIVIRVSYSEGSNFKVLDLDNGEEITVDTLPYFSPNKRKFITICDGYEYDKTTIYELNTLDKKDKFGPVSSFGGCSAAHPTLLTFKKWINDNNVMLLEQYPQKGKPVFLQYEVKLNKWKEIY